MAPADHFQAVVQIEPQPGGHAPPHDGPQLGPVVLERQIAVARLRPGEVRDLAGHPHLGKRRLQQVLDLRGQFPDRQAAVRRSGLWKTWAAILSSRITITSFCRLREGQAAVIVLVGRAGIKPGNLPLSRRRQFRTAPPTP